MPKSDDPGFEAAAKEVLEELRNNRKGAYALAVRIGASEGYQADKLMARAVEMEKEGPQPAGGAPALVDVVFPTAEDLETELLRRAEEAGALSPDTMALAPVLVQLMVEERQRFLTMLGKQ